MQQLTVHDTVVDFLDGLEENENAEDDEEQRPACFPNRYGYLDPETASTTWF